MGVPDPKISPYKLSRDVEEKAKEAKKRKVELDSHLPRYKKIVENFADSIPKEAMDEISTAEKLYSEKDYYESWNHFLKAKNAIDPLINNIIEKKIKFLKGLIEYPFIEKKEIEELLSKAPKDPEEFIKFYSETLELIRIKIKEGINSIKPDELNSEIFKRYGREITGIITMDPQSLKTLLEDISKMVKNYFTEKINSLMEKLDYLRDSYTRIKISTSQFTSINEEVLSMIKEEKYEEAIQKLEKFIEDSEDTLNNVLKRLIANTEKSIEEVRMLKADVEILSKNLNLARDLLSRGEYRKVIDLIRDINSDIERLKVNILENKINEVKERIQKAKEENFDITEVTKVFERTRSLITKRQLQEALASLDEIIARIDGLSSARDNLIKQLDELEKNISMLMTIGLSVDKEAIKKIRDLAKINPYSAKNDLDGYLSSLTKSFEERRGKVISTLERMLTSMENMGISGTWRRELQAIGEKGMLDFVRGVGEILEGIKDSLKSYFDVNFADNAEIRNLLNEFLGSLEKYDLDSASRYMEAMSVMVSDQRQTIINVRIGDIKDLARLVSGFRIDLSFLASELERLANSQIDFEEKQDIINRVYDSVQKGFDDAIKIYLNFTDSVIKLMHDNKLKVQEDILKMRQGIDLPQKWIDRFKNSGYIDSLATNTFSRTATILAEIDLIEKKFGKRIEGISNEINFLRKDLEDLKYEEVREEFNKIVENMETEIIKNGFRELRGMIGYLEDIKRETGLYKDVLPKPDLTTLQEINLSKLYQTAENTLDDFRHRIIVEVSNLGAKKIVFEIFRESFNDIIKNYVERKYIDAWKEIEDLKNRVSVIEGQYEEAKKIIETLEGNLLIFENLGFKFEKSREIIDNLKKTLERLDFKEFMETYRMRYLEVRNEIYSVLNNYLNSVEEKLNSLRGKRNVLVAEGLITSAKRAIKLDKFDETVKYLFDALEDLQADDIVKSISSSLLDRVKNMVAIFGTIRPKDLVDGLARANMHLSQGKYSNAVFELNSLIIKYEGLSKRIESLKIMIEYVKDKINASVSLGLNVQEFLKNYQAARVHFQGGNVEKSFEALESLNSRLNIAIEDAVRREMDALFYIVMVSSYLSIDLTVHYDKMKDKWREIISILLQGNKESISRAINEYRDNVDYIKSRLPDIEKALREKLENLKRIAFNSGLTGFNEHNMLLDLWMNKQYIMLYDMLPMTESKVLRNYVQSFSSFLEDISKEIAKNSHFCQNIYSSLERTLKIYSGAGDIDPLLSVDNIKSFSNEIYSEALNNLRANMPELKEGDDLFVSYYMMKHSIIMNEYHNIINSYFEEKKNAILEVARSNGIEISVPENMPSGIDDLLNYLASMQKDLDEKLKSLIHASQIELKLESDGKKVHGDINIEYKGMEDVKSLTLHLDGSIEGTTIEFGPIKRGERKSRNIVSMATDSSRLRIIAEYDGERKERDIDAYFLIERGFRALKASGNEKCQLCRGRIFKDLDMVICEKCGATYHYQCAKRAGKCTACGNKFDFTEKRELEVKLSL